MTGTHVDPLPTQVHVPAEDGEASVSLSTINQVPPRPTLAAGPSGDGGGETNPPLTPIERLSPSPIPLLRELRSQQVHWLKAELRISNAAGARVRRALGWSLEASETERARITRDAAAVVRHILKDDAPPDRLATFVESLRLEVMTAEQAKAPIHKLRAGIEKEMTKLAATLPVWEAWGKSVRGFGVQSLAVVVGEAGDLSLYPNPAKLWKRFGLAVREDGTRDRRVSGEISGYSPARRSAAWNIGEAMIKVGDTYRAVYLERKAYEQEKRPEDRPAAHHARAKRYMEKRLLRDLWRAWRREA